MNAILALLIECHGPGRTVSIEPIYTVVLHNKLILNSIHQYTPTKQSILNIWLNMKNNCSMRNIKNHGMSCNSLACWFLRLWYKYELRKYSDWVIFTLRLWTCSCWILVHLFCAESKSDKARTFWPQIYTTNIGMHTLLHDIPGFFILFLEQFFLIFNKMLSIGTFGRLGIAKCRKKLTRFWLVKYVVCLFLEWLLYLYHAVGLLSHCIVFFILFVCYPLMKSRGGGGGGVIVLASVRPSVHTFCLSGTISQYLLVRFNSFLVQMISTMDSQYPISLVKIHPVTLELLPLFKYRQL